MQPSAIAIGHTIASSESQNMEQIQPDLSPSQTWKANLDSTCNRLMSHYLSLLRAGTSADGANVDGDGDGHDSRGAFDCCLFMCYRDGRSVC